MARRLGETRPLTRLVGIVLGGKRRPTVVLQEGLQQGLLVAQAQAMIDKVILYPQVFFNS